MGVGDVAITEIELKETTKTQRVQVSEAIPIGDFVRLDPDTSKYQKSDSSTEADANASGIACTPSSGDADWIQIATDGPIGIGGSGIEAVTYTVSDVAGQMGPDADRASTEFKSIIGIGDENGDLLLGFNASGKQVP